MFWVVLALLFMAFSGLLIITALRIEANSHLMQENTRVLLRVEELFTPKSSEERIAIVPPNPPELLDAEMQAIPRRPQCDTLISGSEPPPPRDTTLDVPKVDESVEPARTNETIDDDDGDDEHRPTTVLPRCAKCGSVNFLPTGQSCGKTGYLTFPGLEQRKVA